MFALFVAREKQRSSTIFPELHPEHAARIQLSGDGKELILQRQPDDSWTILTTADTPASADIIARTLEALASAEARSHRTSAIKRRPSTPTVRFQISDEKGAKLANGAVSRSGLQAGNGQHFANMSLPALPLWPSAWADISLPKIAPEDIALVQNMEKQTLPPAANVRAGKILSALRAEGFIARDEHDWANATRRLVELTDGRRLMVEQIPADNGGYWLALSPSEGAQGHAGRAANLSLAVQRLAFQSRDQLQ